LLVVFAAAVLVAACTPSRADLCAKARDQAIPRQERKVREAIAGVDATLRDRVAAKGAEEIAQFKARFVDLCVAQPELDLGCLDEPREKDPACRLMFRPVWKKIYGE
jgi:hypothetical protein